MPAAAYEHARNYRGAQLVLLLLAEGRRSRISAAQDPPIAPGARCTPPFLSYPRATFQYMFEAADPVGAVASIRAGVDALLASDLTALSRDGLLELTRELERQARRIPAVDHRVVAELDERNLAGELACANTATLLHDLLQLHPREAKARVTAARELTERHALSGDILPPVCPAVAAAQRAGTISPAHAKVIGELMHWLAAEHDRAFGAELEQCLVEHAAQLDPLQLARAVTRLKARLDPDGPESRDRENQRRRGVTISPNPDGSSELRGHLTAATTAIWQAIFDSLAAPRPSTEHGRDDRSAAQRRHDALHDAGLRLLRTGTLPDCGGTPVTVQVTVRAEDLRNRTGLADTAHGDTISIAELLHLAAEAEIIPVVLDDAGGVLAYGRTRRYATPAQRRALAARDRGCSFPGCTIPPAWTEVHHVTPWNDGGRTNLDETTLVCDFHHDNHEQAGWTCQMINKIPNWIPPPWIDPDQRPRRNTAHHVEITFDIDPDLARAVHPPIRT